MRENTPKDDVKRTDSKKIVIAIRRLEKLEATNAVRSALGGAGG